MFERRIYKLPEELQAKLFSRVWNHWRIGIEKWAKDATNHRGYYSLQEGLLYNLNFERVMIKLYNGQGRLKNSERGITKFKN